MIFSYHDIDDLLKETTAEAMKREANAFDDIASSFKDSLVLFGAGNLGRKTLAGLRQKGIEPLAFTDNNPTLWGQSLENIPNLFPTASCKSLQKNGCICYNCLESRKRSPYDSYY